MKHKSGFRSSAWLVMSITVLISACGSQELSPTDDARADGIEVLADPAAAIADRVSGYIEDLTVHRDAELARDYYTEDARLLGPGIDLNRESLVAGIRAVFDAGTQVQVNRSTLELFVHGDSAYEIARAEDIFVSPDSTTADTTRNNLFIRWKRGADGKWRFDRVVLGPQE